MIYEIKLHLMSKDIAFYFFYFCFAGLQNGTSWPFIVAGKQVGLIRPDVLSKLTNYPEVFSIQKNSVTLNPAFRDYTERSAKIEAILKECRAQGTFVTLKGWRDEVSCTC